MFKDKIMAEILRNRQEELNILKQQMKEEYQERLQSSLHFCPGNGGKKHF